GQTMQLPVELRLIQHIAEARRGKKDSRLMRWIRKALRDGKKIGIKVLESDCVIDETERRWIAEYRQNNAGILVNTTDGGERGTPGKRSEATKAKMRGPKSEAH